MPRSTAYLGAFVALLPVAACAPPDEIQAVPGAVSMTGHVSVTTDEFSKDIMITSPLMAEETADDIAVHYELSIFVDKQTHSYSSLITAAAEYYGETKHFDFASDDEAQTLRVIHDGAAERPCRTCTRKELFTIFLPYAALRQHAATGYRVEALSRSGNDIVFTFSPAVIAAQEAALKTVLARLGPSPAALAAQFAASPSAPQPVVARNIGLKTLSVSIPEMIHAKVHGVVVLGVTPGGAADKAGIRYGDVIVRFDGHLIDSGSELQKLIAKTRPHRAVKIDILRNGTPIHATIKM